MYVVDMLLKINVVVDPIFPKSFNRVYDAHAYVPRNLPRGRSGWIVMF